MLFLAAIVNSKLVVSSGRHTTFTITTGSFVSHNILFIDDTFYLDMTLRTQRIMTALLMFIVYSSRS